MRAVKLESVKLFLVKFSATPLGGFQDERKKRKYIVDLYIFSLALSIREGILMESLYEERRRRNELRPHGDAAKRR